MCQLLKLTIIICSFIQIINKLVYQMTKVNGQLEIEDLIQNIMTNIIINADIEQTSYFPSSDKIHRLFQLYRSIESESPQSQCQQKSICTGSSQQQYRQTYVQQNCGSDKQYHEYILSYVLLNQVIKNRLKGIVGQSTNYLNINAEVDQIMGDLLQARHAHMHSSGVKHKYDNKQGQTSNNKSIEFMDVNNINRKCYFKIHEDNLMKLLCYLIKNNSKYQHSKFKQKQPKQVTEHLGFAQKQKCKHEYESLFIARQKQNTKLQESSLIIYDFNQVQSEQSSVMFIPK